MHFIFCLILLIMTMASGAVGLLGLAGHHYPLAYPAKPLHQENLWFATCCEQAGFSDELVADMCKYPPCVKCADLHHGKELGENYDAWIGCYTAHQDNTMCCRQHGVRGGLHGAFDACQDLCNGAPPHHHEPLEQYSVCRLKEDAIATCNKHGWTLTHQQHAAATLTRQQHAVAAGAHAPVHSMQPHA